MNIRELAIIAFRHPHEVGLDYVKCLTNWESSLPFGVHMKWDQWIRQYLSDLMSSLPFGIHMKWDGCDIESIEDNVVIAFRHPHEVGQDGWFNFAQEASSLPFGIHMKWDRVTSHETNTVPVVIAFRRPHEVGHCNLKTYGKKRIVVIAFRHPHEVGLLPL